MKIPYKFIFLFIFFSINDLFYCKDEDEDFELLKYKEKKTFELNNTNNEIKLYMEGNTITSKKIYIYVYQTDPTNVDFNYKLHKDKEFVHLDSYLVTNHGSDHTFYYIMDKPENNDYKLYIKVITSKFEKGQKLSIESAESFTDIYIILTIVLIIIITLTSSLVLIVTLYIYKIKRDKSITETTEDVIIEKVYPEDLTPIR